MSKTDDVYRELRQRITTGQYVAGYRLVIDTLAREFGVSAIPVREAIRRLEAERLVVFQPHVGAQVIRVDDITYEEVLTVRARLEGWAAALAAPYIGSPDLDTLRALAQHMDAALDGANLLAYDAINRQFHQTIRQRCPNQYLVEQIDQCSAKLDCVRSTIFTLIPSRARESLQEHYQILQSLAEHAPPHVLERLVEDHHLQTLTAYRQQRSQPMHMPLRPVYSDQ